jgi:hypothetical protein
MWLGDIVGMVCEVLTRHRLGAWVPFVCGEFGRFERAQCRYCRQGFVRPQRLSDIDWTKEA